MKRIQSDSRISKFGGLRVTLFDDANEPVVSLWSSDMRGDRVFGEAIRLKNTTAAPIDAVLQAIAWHGKVVKA